MSWQSYVDDQLLATKSVSQARTNIIIISKLLYSHHQAVICGHDGNIWAASAGFNATVAELKSIATNFGNTDTLAMSGLTVGGTR